MTLAPDLAHDALNVQRLGLGEGGALLNEAEARLGLVAHELLDDIRRRRLVRLKVEAIQIAAAAGDLHAQAACACSGPWSFL